MHTSDTDRAPTRRIRRILRSPRARLAGTALALGVAAVLVAAAALPQQRASTLITTGQVVIFEHELTTLVAFDNPERCNNAPPLAHTLVNLTDGPIILYADDRCGAPLFMVPPNSGSHVAPAQSFSSR